MLILPVHRVLSSAAGAPLRARRFVVREMTPVTPPKPRLLDRVRAARRARHYSRRTEEAYVAWIKRYIFFYTHVLNGCPAAVRSPADRMFGP